MIRVTIKTVNKSGNSKTQQAALNISKQLSVWKKKFGNVIVSGGAKCGNWLMTGFVTGFI